MFLVQITDDRTDFVFFVAVLAFAFVIYGSILVFFLHPNLSFDQVLNDLGLLFVDNSLEHVSCQSL